ncbi:MAG: hypothetical protein GY849_23130, partial [Deltaproteobacteria bacterium]|nr:hypothetical protein [Deltaproteobacteria bacterium]
ESGIHVDGMLKDSNTYAGLDPREFNRRASIVLGKHSGAGSIKYLLEERGYEVDERALGKILMRVKEEKLRQGKEEIHKMLKEIEAYYERALDFPEEAFWDIVKGVIENDG